MGFEQVQILLPFSNPSKCEFTPTELEFLEYIISNSTDNLYHKRAIVALYKKLSI